MISSSYLYKKAAHSRSYAPPTALRIIHITYPTTIRSMGGG